MPFYICIIIIFFCHFATNESFLFCEGDKSYDIKHKSLEHLIELKKSLTSELDQLAHLSFNQGAAPVGFRGAQHKTSKVNDWVRIDFPKPVSFDEIYLIPTFFRGQHGQAQSDAFPKSFIIMSGTSPDSEGEQVYHYTNYDQDFPRTAPLILSLKLKNVSWIKILCTELSARDIDGKFVFQLSELMIFDGKKNIALHQPISSNIPRSKDSEYWDTRYLNDGSLPYLLNSNRGQHGKDFNIFLRDFDHFYFDFDLGASYVLDELHFHRLDLGYTIPSIHHADYAFPLQYKIYGSNTPDFKSKTLLKEFVKQDKINYGSIKIDKLLLTPIRYLRWDINQPYSYLKESIQTLGIAEIQAFHENRNLLQGLIPKSNMPASGQRRLPRLTDNRNNFGEIIPIHDWMKQLAHRHQIESFFPVLEKTITHRLEERTKLFIYLVIAFSLSLLVIFILIILNKIRQQKAIQKTKNLIAADLHDELGANLHSITMLTEMAINKKSHPEKVQLLLEKISDLSRRTSQSSKHCTKVLEASGLYKNTLEDMKHISDKLIGDLKHQWDVQEDIPLKLFSERRQLDFFLFYKECITNILRHSQATEVVTKIYLHKKNIVLSVYDNGNGNLDNDHQPIIPKSLIRRAKLLKAKVQASNPNQKGLQIELLLPTPSKISSFKLTFS